MKITVGLGSIDDYIPFVRAGAGEMFCGYIPDWWNEKYGRAVSLNRREVSYYNVQIGSRSELQILAGMIREYGVPVTIALNSLNYGQEGAADVCRVVEECMEEGFHSFILADPAVIFLLRKKYPEDLCRIHLSGELGEMNGGVLRIFAPMGISRVIFHRKVSICEMKKIVGGDEEESREYEAFALNEMCHFHGGFCNSMHCDELPHMCLVPYRLGQVRDLLSGHPRTGDYRETKEDSTPYPVIGASGCGLCALFELKEAGITHLKLVSRGNYTEDTLRDIRAMKTALQILENSSSKEAYVEAMKEAIFPEGCGKNCYYL